MVESVARYDFLRTSREGREELGDNPVDEQAGIINCGLRVDNVVRFA
jgi:hypothetical protein